MKTRKSDRRNSAPARKGAAPARVASAAARTGKAPAPLAPEAKTREARGAARRAAILAAALDEFSAQGFEAARLDDVARRAGIAKGTIYLYFRDKESLFQELVRTMLAPMIAGIEAIGTVDIPASQLAERFVDLFVREVYGTRRQEVVRLMITEGRRFPKLAEFYYREVLSRIIEAVRGVLKRAAKRGDVPAALIEFPQLIAAPGLVAIIWSGLFERFEPLDVRKMMTAHVELLFAPRRAA
ncbi:MAG TPA: TetR/AcrR family transcriptional regulator [Pseudolabrys sp.]|nr:TetR/AcrR family transcriptional regulator [Pseudolabrys sp.]